MLPNLPLDVNNSQLRVGDHVIYSFPDSCHMAQGRVAKMTDCFVWLKIPMVSHKLFRRDFRRVAIVGGD